MGEGAAEPSFAIGDTVRITRGIFEDFIGRIDRIDGITQPAKVNLEISGMSSRVNLEYDRCRAEPVRRH
jgi:transcription antitermination factor NusG